MSTAPASCSGTGVVGESVERGFNCSFPSPVKPMTYKIDTCQFLRDRGKDRLALCQDNVIDSDIAVIIPAF